MTLLCNDFSISTVVKFFKPKILPHSTKLRYLSKAASPFSFKIRLIGKSTSFPGFTIAKGSTYRNKFDFEASSFKPDNPAN
jgi:hypothetical protein